MKYTLILFFSFIVNVSFAQGIAFETFDFQSALNKAKAEDKLVFMDAYATWCGPCKWMSKNVFTDADVGAYFNANFINIKIDMEKGEGIELAKRYNVDAYPILLFIDGNGELMHYSAGSRPADDFLDLGKAANDPNRQFTTMKRRFDSGERSSEFLKSYTDALTSAGMNNFEEIAQLYMDSQKDWTTEENMTFLFNYSEATLDSKLFQYSLKNKDSFIALLGEDKFNQKLRYAADYDRGRLGIVREDVDNLKLHYVKYFPVEKANNMAMMSYFNQIMYSPNPVDQEMFKAEIQLFLADKPDIGSKSYNAIAWQIYEITADKNLLTKAAEWAQISIDGKKDSHNTDTMAAIQCKLGNYESAKAFAIESIDLAKKSGNDYSATQDLLSKITSKFQN